MVIVVVIVISRIYYLFPHHYYLYYVFVLYYYNLLLLLGKTIYSNTYWNILHDEIEKYCPVKKMGSTNKYYRAKQPYWKLKLCSAERPFLKRGHGEPWKKRALRRQRLVRSDAFRPGPEV